MSTPHARYRNIPLEELAILEDEQGEPLNPRGPITDTTDLQASLQMLGQLQPIVVGKRRDDGKWPIIDGHRRAVAFWKMRARDHENAGTGRWNKISAVERPPEVPELAAMLGANMREDIKPSRMGAALQSLSANYGWPLERAAAAMGMSVPEADLYCKAAQAPENVRRRLDNGEIAWSTWKRRLAKMPRQIQEEVAEMEEPTADHVKARIREMTQPAERMIDDEESMLQQVNEARVKIEGLLAARPWSPELQHRIAYALNRIHELTGAFK